MDLIMSLFWAGTVLIAGGLGYWYGWIMGWNSYKEKSQKAKMAKYKKEDCEDRIPHSFRNSETGKIIKCSVSELPTGVWISVENTEEVIRYKRNEKEEKKNE